MGSKPTYKELEQRIKDLESRITHFNDVEKFVKETDERYSSLLEASPDPIVVYDMEGRTIYINPAFSETFGWSSDELLGKRIDFVPEENWPETKAAIRRMIQGKKVQLFETKRLTKENRTLDIQLSSSLFQGMDGKPSGNIVILRDITMQKLAEETIRKSQDELEQRVKERTAELVLINKNLQKEIVDRQHAEAELVKSKSMLKAVIENLPFDVFAIDRNNRYILQNETCKKNWGNLMGKYPEDVPVDKHTKDLWLDNNRRALSGETVAGEVTFDRLNGEKSYYYNIITPIRDGEEIFGILGVIIDISKLKRAEEAVRESRERFRNLTEMTSDWIWEVDQNLFYTYASPKIFDILGYRAEEIIGKTPFDLMPTEEAERVLKIVNAIAAKQEPFDCLENINLHKDGHPVVLETSGTPIFDSGGELCGYRGVDRDITPRKQIEKELRKSHDELENRVEERTRELKLQKSNLEEANIALQVLLEKRQEDKKEIEDNVLTNVKELIMPYLKKMGKTKLDDQQNAFLNIIESNIYEIISPFTRKMSQKYLNLTPTEIEVANLIRNGSNSKEIAELMGLSSRTIYNHRKNIRKKLGLENRKTNLRSHLLSIY
jgi:PAS domain S-box-containing protein